MSVRVVLITGASGGIGRVLCRVFHESGWQVIAIDRIAVRAAPGIIFLPIDVGRLCVEPAYRSDTIAGIQSHLPGGKLDALINNAAVQLVAPVEALSASDWQVTMQVNVIAPFLLVQSMLAELTAARGSVVNIGSIHAELTKPNMTAYATSKAALGGLTRALAVELGGRVRVNAIQPAAIDTPMLMASFPDDKDGVARLARHHPSGSIGTPEVVARAALYLAGEESPFLNGAIIGVDGGIASRLHDPA